MYVQWQQILQLLEIRVTLIGRRLRLARRNPRREYVQRRIDHHIRRCDFAAHGPNHPGDACLPDLRNPLIRHIVRCHRSPFTPADSAPHRTPSLSSRPRRSPLGAPRDLHWAAKGGRHCIVVRCGPQQNEAVKARLNLAQRQFSPTPLPTQETPTRENFSFFAAQRRRSCNPQSGFLSIPRDGTRCRRLFSWSSATTKRGACHGLIFGRRSSISRVTRSTGLAKRWRPEPRTSSSLPSGEESGS